jgi:hypothetical protein
MKESESVTMGCREKEDGENERERDIFRVSERVRE